MLRSSKKVDRALNIVKEIYLFLFSCSYWASHFSLVKTILLKFWTIIIVRIPFFGYNCNLANKIQLEGSTRNYFVKFLNASEAALICLTPSSLEKSRLSDGHSKLDYSVSINILRSTNIHLYLHSFQGFQTSHFSLEPESERNQLHLAFWSYLIHCEDSSLSLF
jgi:hypothetical protein